MKRSSITRLLTLRVGVSLPSSIVHGVAVARVARTCQVGGRPRVWAEMRERIASVATDTLRSAGSIVRSRASSSQLSRFSTRIARTQGRWSPMIHTCSNSGSFWIAASRALGGTCSPVERTSISLSRPVMKMLPFRISAMSPVLSQHPAIELGPSPAHFASSPA